jgi:class 3 adenylate cyclase
MEVPEANVVFTVKLPASLAARVREHAHERGVTISAAVTRALAEFLHDAPHTDRRAERGQRSR